MTPYQQCCEAIKVGDRQIVKSLYDQDRYVRKSIREFMELAADIEQTEMLDFFADFAANPVRGELLQKIAESGRVKSVKWMIDHGVMSNTAAVQAALLKAVKNQHLEVVKLLVEHGADINYDDVKENVNPLTMATGSVRELLIEAGAKTLFQVRREAALRAPAEPSESTTNVHRSNCAVAFQRSDEEHWITEIVADQTNNALKLSYAEWLQRQGGPRGTSEAFRHRDPSETIAGISVAQRCAGELGGDDGLASHPGHCQTRSLAASRCHPPACSPLDSCSRNSNVRRSNPSGRK